MPKTTWTTIWLLRRGKCSSTNLTLLTSGVIFCELQAWSLALAQSIIMKSNAEVEELQNKLNDSEKVMQETLVDLIDAFTRSKKYETKMNWLHRGNDNLMVLVQKLRNLVANDAGEISSLKG